MILDINRTMGSYVNFISEPINTVTQVVGNLASRAIQQLHQNHNIAIALYVVSNYAFISLADNFAKSVELNTDKYFVNLTEKQRVIKNFLLNGAVIGSFAAIFNALLSKATQHPISRNILSVIVIGTIAARIILKEAINRYQEYLKLKTDLASAQSLIAKMQTGHIEIFTEKKVEKERGIFDEAQIEIDSLSESLEEAKITIKKLEDELKEAQALIIQKSEIENENADLKEFKVRLEEAQSKIVFLSEALEIAKKKVETPTKDSEDDVIELPDAETQKKVSQDLLNQFYVGEVEKLKADIEGLQKEITLKEEEDAVRDKEIEALNQALLEKADEIDILKLAIDEKINKLEKLQAEIESEAANKKELNELISELEALLKDHVKLDGKEQLSLFEQIKKMISDKEELVKELKALQIEKEKVDQELKFLKEKAAASESHATEDHHADGKSEHKRSLGVRLSSFGLGSKTPKKSE